MKLFFKKKFPLVIQTLLLPSLLLGAVGTPAPPAAGCNVIMIGWDTLRADHLGVSGYKRATTPNIDALARRSYVFTRAKSPSSWTLPAFMSIFTSLPPSRHGVTNKYKLSRNGGPELEMTSLSTETATLSQLFKANGYRTAAFTGGAGMGGHFGFNRGFDVYVDSGNFMGFETTFPQALEWLKNNRESKFFVFVHGYDTHPFHDLKTGGDFSFIPSSERAAALKIRRRHEKLRMARLDGKKISHTAADVRLWNDVYDEKILRTDRLLGKFLADFGAIGTLGEKTVIVLVSDHGEELFDHGWVDHGMTLYEEVIHVPLLIHVPRGPNRVIDAQVRTLDLFPTLIELLGLRADAQVLAQMRGTSLLEHMKGGNIPLEAFSETDYLFHSNKRSLSKSSGIKLIYDGLSQERELYDTSSDPLEKRNLFDKKPAESYTLEMELLNWEDNITQN